MNALEQNLNIDLQTICQWLNDNYLILNVDKCKFVLFGSSHKLKPFSNLSLEINEHLLERSESIKYLGVKINQTLSWIEHIHSISMKVRQRLGVLRRNKHLLPLHVCLTYYSSLFLPLVDYTDLVWGDKNNVAFTDHLQDLQNNSARVLLDLPKHSSASLALE